MRRDFMRAFVMAGAAVALGVALVRRQLRRSSHLDRLRLEHVSETARLYRNEGTRILILGAGFGGLSTALKLDQQLRYASDTSVLVVGRDNDMLFNPLLWTVANGRTNPNDAVVRIRDFQKERRFHVLQAEVEHIDLERKEVQTSVGIRPYDKLVIALGSHTRMPDLPGLRKYALPFHTTADALQLRNHLIDAVEAAHHSEDPQERQAWLTFVVGGAGDTGVELAATIQDYITSGLFSEYPWLADAPAHIILVGHAERILPLAKPGTAELVRRVLEREGIEIRTGTAITGVTERTVETNKGIIAARTLFWAAGIQPAEVVRELPVQHAHNGAIMVDDYLRIPGHPEVYVIGDSSWAYDSMTRAPVAATAQAARQQGFYVGQTIAREYAKRPTPPYRYNPLGHLALLGHYVAVAEIGPFTFGGFPAFLLWHLAYLERNPSWRKRIRLVVDWTLSALLGREIGELRLDTEQAAENGH